MPNDRNVMILMGKIGALSDEQISLVERFIDDGCRLAEDLEDFVLGFDSEAELDHACEVLALLVNGGDELLPVDVVRRMVQQSSAFEQVRNVVDSQSLHAPVTPPVGATVTSLPARSEPESPETRQPRRTTRVARTLGRRLAGTP